MKERKLIEISKVCTMTLIALIVSVIKYLLFSSVYTVRSSSFNIGITWYYCTQHPVQSDSSKETEFVQKPGDKVVIAQTVT